MNSGLQMLITLVIGSSVAIGGVMANAGDIINNAKTTVNSANVYQLSTALEMYYLDHNAYPPVQGGTALVDLLSAEDYIKNKPLDPSVFLYQPVSNGQNYQLALK